MFATTKTTTAIFMVCLALVTIRSTSGMNPNRRCTNKQRECGDILQVLSKIRNNTANINIASLCAQTETNLQCYGDCTPALRVMPMVGLGIRVREYLCEPSRRDEVNTVLRSQCLQDNSLSRSADSSMDVCMDRLMADPNANTVATMVYMDNDLSSAHLLCPAVEQMRTCIGDSISGVCGPEVMPVASHLLQMVFNDLVMAFLPPCATPIL